MVVLEPHSTDTTSLVTYQLTNRPPAAGGHADVSRDANFVALGAIEDRNMAVAVQAGLRSSANEMVERGSRVPSPAPHTQLTDLVDGSPVTAPQSRSLTGMTQAVR